MSPESMNLTLLSKNKADLTLEPKEENSNLAAICRIIQSNITFSTCQRADANLILHMSVATACERTLISELCRRMEGSPSHTTCLTTLHRLDMEEMVRQSSTMLKQVGEGVVPPSQTYTFAIDKTSDPYYGQRNTDPGLYTVGGKRKASTNNFYTYLTLSIVDKDCHITPLAIPWQQGMKNLTTIQNCIDLITSLNLKICCLCLDSEFYNCIER